MSDKGFRYRSRQSFCQFMIWVQSVCKHYQQMTKVAISKERVNREEPVIGKLVLLQHIRIYHECGGRVEKSVQRIAVWHHKACLVMTNGDPEGRIFLTYPYTNNGFYFLLTTVFIYFKTIFQKSLITLRCNFTL